MLLKHQETSFDEVCGIAGIINLKGESTICYPSSLQAMSKCMASRGPNDEGYVLFAKDGTAYPFYGDDTPLLRSWDDRTIIPGYPCCHIKMAGVRKCVAALAHRRLSIVDLSLRGHQPMTTPDQRYWIVYNGEVYNFKEIARVLAAHGVELISGSDTEVVLRSYILWGPACVERFNGMFAFAIWDNFEKTLFCARDRIGIKPFYYTIVGNQFVFASDIKTIIASGLYSPEPDMEGLYLAMAFGIAPRPKTAFRDVAALEQAHWMIVDARTETIKKERYWTIPIGTQNLAMTEDEAVELLEDRLLSSISYRLVADVPVGTFMSGGIDSTTISAIASKLHPGIKAFTLSFGVDAPERDEVVQASATAAMYPMEHIIRHVRPDDTLCYLYDWVDGYEEPFYHLAANFVISQVVKENGVTVALNGIGGDELFAGYSYYLWASRYSLLRKMAFFAPIVEKVAAFTGSDRLRRLSQILQVSSPDQLHTALFAKTDDHILENLFDVPELKGFNTIEFIHEFYSCNHRVFTDPLEAMSYMDLINYIGNHHVHRMDQFTMAHSIESRFPFLDHTLIEAAFMIPSCYKLRGEVQKYILRRVAEKYISPLCLIMKKKGFGLPLKQWMEGALTTLVREKLRVLRNREFLNSDYINGCLVRYEEGNYPVAHTWHLVMLELWIERFLEGKIDG